MVGGTVRILRGALDRLEALHPAIRLSLAWVACVAPRAAFAARFGVGHDYTYFLDGDTDSAWYPLYESLASGLWAASGGRVRVHVAFHLALHSLIGPLVYALSKRLGLGGRTAWLAALGVAGLPYYVSVGARQPQVGLTIVLMALLLLIFAAWKAERFGPGPGLLFALASAALLTLRPNAASTIAALYGLAALWTLARPRSRSIAAARPVVASGVLLLLLTTGLAWRNLQREGRFSPFTGNLGFNLYMGNNPQVGAYALRYDITSLQDTTAGGIPAEAAATPLADRDRVFRRLALDYIRRHPLRSAWNAVLKSWRYWDVRLEDARLTPPLENLAYTLPYLGYGSLALAGAWRLWSRRHDALIVIGAVIVSYWLPHAVFFGTVRMRMTVEFLLVALAAAWLTSAAIETERAGSRSP